MDSALPQQSEERAKRGVRRKTDHPPPPPPSSQTSAAPSPSSATPHAPSPSTSGPSGIKQCFRTVKSARRVTVALKAGPPPPPSPPPLPRESRSATRKRRKRESPPLASPPSPVAGPSRPSSSALPPVPLPVSVVSAKRHGCRHCSKKFSSPGKLQQHVLSHTGELPYACQRCDKRFNSKFKLVRHNLIHSETRPFACPLCDKSFHRKDHLSNHERVHDPVKKLYVCERPDCKKRYASLLCFRKHAALHSAEEGELDCKICSKTFESRAEIVYHLKVHAGSRTVKNETDKKFKCEHCERKFFTGKDVRRHLVVHTGKRDFVCQFCPQKFGRKDHLVRHVKKTHPGESWQSSVPSTSGANDPLEDDPSGPSESREETDAEEREGESGVDVKTEAASREETTDESLEVFDFGSDAAFGRSLVEIPRPYDRIKNEPAVEACETEATDYGQIVAQKPMPLENIADVGPGPSGVSDKYSNFIYMMSSPPYSVNKDGLEMIGEGSVLPDIREEALEFSERPMQSVLMSGDVSDVPITGQEIFDFFKSTVCDQQVQERQTVLPSFDQVFQNATQNPKPPRRPSER